MEPEALAARSAQIAALVERLDAQTDPTVAMIDDYVKQADGDALGLLLRRAALPRRLDGGVVALLTGSSGDAQRGAELLSQLQDYPFVRRHPGGGLTYHDRVRDALRTWWRAEPRLSEFVDLSQQLEGYQLERLDEARRLSRELQIATPTLRQANPARLTAIRTTVEGRLIVAFKEALYHARAVGTGEVRQLLLNRISEIDSEPRLVEVALGEVRTTLREAADDVDPLDHCWLRYCEGRFLRNLGRYEEAEEVLRAALAEAEAHDAPDFSRPLCWILGALGLCLEERERFLDAEAMYVRGLQVQESLGLDSWDLTVAHLRLGQFRMSRMHMRSAAESFALAAQAARTSNHTGAEIRSLTREAEARHLLGETQEALTLATRALHLSRVLPARRLAEGTSASDDLETHRQLDLVLASLLAPSGLRLVDSVIAETDVLAAGPESDEQRARAQLLLSEVLADAGALERAQEVLDVVPAMVRELDDPEARQGVGITIHFRQAHMARCAGAFTAEVQGWDELLNDQVRDSPWNSAAARSNRAEALIALGRLDEAAEALDQAQHSWSELGLTCHVALVSCAMADVRVRQGSLEQAADALDVARPELDGGPTFLADEFVRVAANLHQARGELAEAAEMLERQGTLAGARGDLGPAARAFGEAASTATRIGDWDRASRCAQRSADLLKQLRGRQRSRPSAEQLEADRNLQAAAQLFFEGSDERSKDLAQARRHLETALRLDPRNSWLHVARYYVCVEQPDLKEAARVLQSLQTLSPEWLAPWLAERAVDASKGSGPAASDGALADTWAELSRPLGRVARQLRRKVSGPGSEA
jgi:tetratricopeptide (TPR) repeat protein